MKKPVFVLILAICLFASSYAQEGFVLSNRQFMVQISPEGMLKQLGEPQNNSNYLFGDSLAPLLAVRVENDFLYPQKAVLNKDNNTITLSFAQGIGAKVKTEVKTTHITFELVEITGSTPIDLITWGPYPLTLKKSIAETVGVAEGETYAIGLQALNIKTLGGYPWTENDCMPQIDIFDQDDYSDMSENNKRYVLYRVEAAKPTNFGSSLQAYCRNRDKERIIVNWDHENYVAPAYEDGGVQGSKIALFGCPVSEVLNTLGEIEIAEGLPHPMIDGTWGKQSKTASSAYLIIPFGEKDIDKAIAITQKAGLRYLYHPEPFATWGNFEIDTNFFPHGIAGLKSCVDKVTKQDIMVGVHVLSNFITTNDKYVTPVPDKRLAKVGSSEIPTDVDEKQSEILVESPMFFKQMANNNLRTVHIGDELIRYGGVTENEPWMLTGCQRGAFGTKAAMHQAGETVNLLADHGYKVFLTNPELTIEMSKNVADLFNQAGLRQISFDGLEGNRSTGMGNYGEILFTKTWFDRLKPELRLHYIADASRTSHYFWHIYTRMNWGEPWYAGFRESQTEYRMKNQEYFSRNYMPGMLGWFNMTPGTSPEDMEWMLARSAAFDAGYAFCTSYSVIEKNGFSDQILQFINVWEKARMAGAFSPEMKELMKDLGNEFHLEAKSQNEWLLTRMYSFKFKHEKKPRQPGEPAGSAYNFENPGEKQPASMIITAQKGEVANINLELDHHRSLDIPFELKQGYSVKYEGKGVMVIYDNQWKLIREIPFDPGFFVLEPGKHDVIIDCDFKEGDEAVLSMELRFKGATEVITGN